MIDLTPRPLRLLDVYEDGEDARHFCFQLMERKARDQEVIPGQFLMLVLPGHGEAPFTYVSPPDARGRFHALIRRTGELTAALFAQSPGAVLGYRGPFGHGWPLLLEAKRVLIVAGGCGLAPLAGLIDEVLNQRLPIALQVLYGARHRAAQVLGQERARWRVALPLVETLDLAAADETQGTPLAHLDAAFDPQPPEAVLCCGPEALMAATASDCLARGLAATKIWLSLERRMHCGVGLCGHCHVGESYACVDGPTYRYDRFRELLARSGARVAADPAMLSHC